MTSNEKITFENLPDELAYPLDDKVVDEWGSVFEDSHSDWESIIIPRTLVLHRQYEEFEDEVEWQSHGVVSLEIADYEAKFTILKDETIRWALRAFINVKVLHEIDWPLLTAEEPHAIDKGVQRGLDECKDVVTNAERLESLSLVMYILWPEGDAKEWPDSPFGAKLSDTLKDADLSNLPASTTLEVRKREPGLGLNPSATNLWAKWDKDHGWQGR